MFQSLSKNLEKAIKTLKGQGRITEINIAATIKEIRRSLVQADVHYKVAKQLTDIIKQKAIGTDIITAVSPGQLFTKLVRDELAQLMGGIHAEVRLSGNPAIILVAGLQGAGKTTLAGKLAYFYKKRNKTPLLVACDIYRPAAVEQLQQLGKQLGVAVYAEPEEKNLCIIVDHALQAAKQQIVDLLIIDTAGRLAIDKRMMEEISMLKAHVKPAETLFVVDAMTGQDAVTTAQAFHEYLDFDGIVLTKLDGDTRGGAALSIRSVVEKPIKLISTGEKMQDLDLFHPDRMANRILGMGDVISLVERAEQLYTEEQHRNLSKKIKSKQFDLEDFVKQMQRMRKLGNLKEIASMLPGVGKALEWEEMDFDATVCKDYEVIVSSMTLQERKKPHIIDRARRERIAQGSGTTMQKVNQLLKHFDMACKIVKKMGKHKLRIGDSI